MLRQQLLQAILVELLDGPLVEVLCPNVALLRGDGRLFVDHSKGLRRGANLVAVRVPRCQQKAKIDPFLSLDFDRVEGKGGGGMLRSVAEPQSLNPKGPKAYNLKNWLQPSGHPGFAQPLSAPCSPFPP